MHKNLTGYYFIVALGMELVVKGSKITKMENGYIEADEAFSIQTETSTLGQKQMKFGSYRSVAINFSFMTELHGEKNPLIQGVKEFEMKLRSNIQIDGNA